MLGAMTKGEIGSAKAEGLMRRDQERAVSVSSYHIWWSNFESKKYGRMRRSPIPRAAPWAIVFLPFRQARRSGSARCHKHKQPVALGGSGFE